MEYQSNSKQSAVLTDFPDPGRNIFLMMKFRDTKQNNSIYQALKETSQYYGYNLLRADQRSYANDLWTNVQEYMHACDYGIAVFDQINERNFNPNVSIELGYMLALEKSCLILKEERMPDIPTDIAGQLYKEFDAFNISESVRERTLKWFRDIGIGKTPGERLVIFISTGGTCRCAMAKVVLQQALQSRQLPFRLRVESLAYDLGDTRTASNGAQRAIKEQYGQNHLSDHYVREKNPGLLSDADLVLVMEDRFLEGIDSDHAYNFNEFFGFSGDVPNPWPDKDTEEARERYQQCLSHLREAIEPNAISRIVRYLNS